MKPQEQKKSPHLFPNTEEAVEFGKRARELKSPDMMMCLFSDFYKQTLQVASNISFNIQMFNEAYHAFISDEWYETYLKNQEESD